MLAFWLIPFSLGMPLIAATGGCTGADPRSPTRRSKP